MTELDWDQSNAPNHLIQYLRETAGILRVKRGRRKLRLFGCACCRRILHLLPDRRSSEAIEIAELFAEGRISARVLKEAQLYANSVPPQGITDSLWNAHNAASSAVYALCAYATVDPIRARSHVGIALRWVSGVQDERAEMEVHAQLLRDIFGNPFRPVSIDPRWLTSTVVDLANAIYDERAFNRMPILADALMDAGCDIDEVIAHCRSDGPHVLGCWVVDRILGKE
jgi:hypothetical protein